MYPARKLSNCRRSYRHEPSLGLFGAEDGIAIAGRLLEQSADRLSAEGWLILETRVQCRRTGKSFSRSAISVA